MTRHWRQVPCTRLSISGACMVDWRYQEVILDNASEAAVWAEVWQRRDPDLALFIEDRCVHKGAFPTKEAAFAKLKAHGGLHPVRPRGV